MNKDVSIYAPWSGPLMHDFFFIWILKVVRKKTKKVKNNILKQWFLMVDNYIYIYINKIRKVIKNISINILNYEIVMSLWNILDKDVKKNKRCR